MTGAQLMKPTPVFLYTALGDSITRGYSAPGKRGYVQMLSSKLAATHPDVRTMNAGQKGLTTEGLLFWLSFSVTLQQALRQAHLVTLWIGGNDLLYAYIRKNLLNTPDSYEQVVYRYRTHLNGILSRIQSFSRAPLVVCNLYNPFPRSQLSLRWVSAINHSLMRICARRNLPIVDIYSAFRGREAELIHGYRTGRLTDIRLFGGNPIHPNLRGHQVITRRLLKVLHDETIPHHL